MIAFLRANPAVVVMLGLVALATVMLLALSAYMTRLGMSLKPVVFMAVFLGIIVGPQLAFHLAPALGVIPKRDLAWTFGSSRSHAGWVEQEDALRAENGRFLDPAAVFGPNADRDLVSDLRRAGADSPFGSAQVAAMAIIRRPAPRWSLVMHHRSRRPMPRRASSRCRRASRRPSAPTVRVRSLARRATSRRSSWPAGRSSC